MTSGEYFSLAEFEDPQDNLAVENAVNLHMAEVQEMAERAVVDSSEITNTLDLTRQYTWEQKISEEVAGVVQKDPSSIGKLKGVNNNLSWIIREPFIAKVLKSDFNFLKKEDLDTVSGLLSSVSGIEDKKAEYVRELIFNKFEVHIENNRQNDKENKKLYRQIFLKLLDSSIGVDDGISWRIRKAAKAVMKNIRYSVAGLDSGEAWEIRFRKSKNPEANDDLLFSLIGLDSETAWEIRKQNYDAAKKSLEVEEILLESMAGCIGANNGDFAEDYRNTIYKSKGVYAFTSGFFSSLIGLDTENAWLWRERAFALSGEKNQKYRKQELYQMILVSLRSVYSERAEKFRERVETKVKEDFPEDQNLQNLAYYNSWISLAVRRAHRQRNITEKAA